jgi:hypothetical protein
MIETGQLQRIITEYYGLQQIRYLLLVKADLTALKASFKEVVDKVVRQELKEYPEERPSFSALFIDLYASFRYICWCI